MTRVTAGTSAVIVKGYGSTGEGVGEFPGVSLTRSK